MTGVAAPLAHVVLNVARLRNLVLERELVVREVRRVAAVEDSRVGAVFLRELGERGPSRVVLILTVRGKKVLVEAADGLDGDRVHREERVAVAGKEPPEPLVRACTGNDVAVPAANGLLRHTVEVALGGKNVVVRDNHDVGPVPIRVEDPVVPAAADAAVSAVGVVADFGPLGELVADHSRGVFVRVQEEMDCDVALGG